MSSSLKVAQVAKECVACGCCTSVCPRSAISIYKGIRAVIDAEKCVGCDTCAKICPADLIVVTMRINNEKEMV